MNDTDTSNLSDVFLLILENDLYFDTKLGQEGYRYPYPKTRTKFDENEATSDTGIRISKPDTGYGLIR